MVIGMDHITTVIIATNTITLVFGGIVTAVAVRAYLRTGAPALRALAVGLGLVTVGTVVGGVVHQLLSIELLTAVAIQSAFTAAGCLALALSLTRESIPQSIDIEFGRPES